jgi:hypothetical protein
MTWTRELPMAPWVPPLINRFGSFLGFLSVGVVAAMTANAAAAADLPKRRLQSLSVSSVGAWPKDVGSDCREWTDSCRVCVRTENNEFSCSTVGIACLPRAGRCTRK